MTRKIFFTALAVLLTFGLAMAQVPTGKIVGRVTDAEGAPLPGVSVTCDSARMVGVANAVTDETGTYRVFSLPSGTFSVRFTLPGFKTLTRRDIILQLEQTITLNVQLEQSALAEEVTVVGQSPLIDVKSTVKGSTMTKDVFMQLPRSRNFDGLLSTVPGVQYEDNQGGLSVDGASGTENMWYIDGTNIGGVHRGLRDQSIVMEQLDEVKVTASGYPAEFGGGMGGVVNVISRSGGNEFHGDMFGYYNNNRLWMQGKDRQYLRRDPYAYPYVAEYVSNDDLYFNGGKDRDDYQRFEGVFNLGGYIFKDRLWFFGSFNPIFDRTYGDRWFRSDPVNLAAAKIPNDLSHDPRQGRQLYTGFYSKNWRYNWQAKMTIAPFKGMRVSLSAVNNWRQYRGSIPGITGTGTKFYSYYPDYEFSPDLTKGQQPGYTYPNWSGNATIDYTVSNNFLISLRGGFFHTNTKDAQLFVPGTRYSFGRSNMTLFPEIPDSLRHDQGWSNGAGTSITQRYITERISGNLDMTYYLNLAGEHAVKAGVQFVRLHEDVFDGPTAPMVTVYWGVPYDLPDGTRIQGKYGYYEILGDWVSPYGSAWNMHSEYWALYLQDSWTLGQKLTMNFGLRSETEFVPPFDPDPKWKDFKPVQFSFAQKLAPRVGAVYDVFGDSSLKVFGSFGLYYDVMKPYLAEGAYGGFLWWTSLYELNDYDFTKIAANGKIDDKTSQTVGGVNPFRSTLNNRTTSFDYREPDLLPVAQSETSFGAEKKVSEEISFSARLVYKHLIRTIEDVGILMPNPYGGVDEQYYIANPGLGVTRSISQGGEFLDKFWPCPKAKREYYSLNLALEKRFSNNWQGGINYTWSRMTGNYGGLSSSDEGGRNSPNTERYWDLWYERYDAHGKPLDGVLPSDRTHYIKAYGSYAFPFGLTVGVVAYGRSGLPMSTSIMMGRMPIFPEGYFDTGLRAPFTMWADMYLEYNLRIAKKYTVNLNVTIYNITNTSTIQNYNYRANILRISLPEDTELNPNAWDWKKEVATHEPEPQFQKWSSRYGAWSWRMGARFSF